MKGQKNNGYYSLQRGAVLPKELVPTQDGIRFSFDGRFILMYAFDRPTVEEKQAFKSGNPCQFGLAVVDDVIFFLSRFGTLKWMDAPFNIHLYPDDGRTWSYSGVWFPCNAGRQQYRDNRAAATD